LRDGQPSPHRPRLVVSRSTCPPISPPPPTRKQLCTRSCSNKLTHTSAAVWDRRTCRGCSARPRPSTVPTSKLTVQTLLKRPSHIKSRKEGLRGQPKPGVHSTVSAWSRLSAAAVHMVVAPGFCSLRVGSPISKKLMWEAKRAVLRKPAGRMDS